VSRINGHHTVVDLLTDVSSGTRGPLMQAQIGVGYPTGLHVLRSRPFPCAARVSRVGDRLPQDISASRR